MNRHRLYNELSLNIHWKLPGNPLAVAAATMVDIFLQHTSKFVQLSNLPARIFLLFFKLENNKTFNGKMRRIYVYATNKSTLSVKLSNLKRFNV